MLQSFKTEHFFWHILQLGQICGHSQIYSKITLSEYPPEKFKNKRNVQQISQEPKAKYLFSSGM